MSRSIKRRSGRNSTDGKSLPVPLSLPSHNGDVEDAADDAVLRRKAPGMFEPTTPSGPSFQKSMATRPHLFTDRVSSVASFQTTSSAESSAKADSIFDHSQSYSSPGSSTATTPDEDVFFIPPIRTPSKPGKETARQLLQRDGETPAVIARQQRRGRPFDKSKLHQETSLDESRPQSTLKPPQKQRDRASSSSAIEGASSSTSSPEDINTLIDSFYALRLEDETGATVLTNRLRSASTGGTVHSKVPNKRSLLPLVTSGVTQKSTVNKTVDTSEDAELVERNLAKAPNTRLEAATGTAVPRLLQLGPNYPSIRGAVEKSADSMLIAIESVDESMGDGELEDEDVEHDHEDGFHENDYHENDYREDNNLEDDGLEEDSIEYIFLDEEDNSYPSKLPSDRVSEADETKVNSEVDSASEEGTDSELSFELEDGPSHQEYPSSDSGSAPRANPLLQKPTPHATPVAAASVRFVDFCKSALTEHEIHFKLLEAIRSKRTVDNLKSHDGKRDGLGYIYVYEFLAHPGFFKIGFSTGCTTGRIKDWTKKCRLATKDITLGGCDNSSADISANDSNSSAKGAGDKLIQPRLFKFARLAERLVHTELHNFRRVYVCTHCKIKHREVFKCDIRQVRASMKRWEDWLAKYPYDSNGFLKPRWHWRLERFQSRNELLDLDKVFQKFSSWDEFRYRKYWISKQKRQYWDRESPLSRQMMMIVGLFSAIVIASFVGWLVLMKVWVLSASLAFALLWISPD